MRLSELGGYVSDVTMTGGFDERYHLSGTLTHERDGTHWWGRRRWWATDNRAVMGVWQMAGSQIVPPAPLLSTNVSLDPTTQAGPRGMVVLTDLPDGETRFELHLSELVPGATYSLQLHAGTTGLVSASGPRLTTVQADIVGHASTGGLVRFRDVEDIALLDIADGAHVLTVVTGNQIVAVGRIPVLQPLG